MSLDRLLGHLALTIAPFAVCDIRRGGQLVMPGGTRDGMPGETPGEQLATMHFVLGGSGTLSAGSGRFELGRTTLVLVPPGMAHRIDAGARGPDDGDGHLETDLDGMPRSEAALGGIRRIVRGSGDSGLVVACGALRAEVSSIGLFDRLAAPLVERFDGLPRMRSLFDTIFEEQQTAGPGYARMLEALMTQCLIHLLRRACDRDIAELTWLAALEEPGLSQALTRILDRPEAPHTLEALAQVAAMSRTTFSERFGAAFGSSPMAFVRQVRLQRAAKLLRSTDLPVKAVAARVGFASRSHFSRAFRQQFDRDPADYRSAGDDPDGGASPPPES